MFRHFFSRNPPYHYPANPGVPYQGPQGPNGNDQSQFPHPQYGPALLFPAQGPGCFYGPLNPGPPAPPSGPTGGGFEGPLQFYSSASGGSNHAYPYSSMQQSPLDSAYPPLSPAQQSTNAYAALAARQSYYNDKTREAIAQLKPLTAPTAQQFSYDSVRLLSNATNIRLLTLRPSRDDGATLHANLSVAPISNARNFKALSYTWGSNKMDHSILIGGLTFCITASLHMALKSLRKRTEDIALWVDQICINQGNDVEKTAQINLMNKIYSQAEQVLVWLGPTADGSDALMDLFASIGREAAILRLDTYNTMRERAYALQRILKDANSTDETEVKIRALFGRAASLFKDHMHAAGAWYRRPWFTRVWIIQEFSLNPDTVFVCGSKQVQAEVLMLGDMVFRSSIFDAVKNDVRQETLTLMADITKDTVSPLFNIRRSLQDAQHQLNRGYKLYNLLRRAYVNHHTEATDPRDRIFGLLGLAVDADRLGISVDCANKDIVQIFTQAAASIIHSGCLDLLSLSQFPKDIPGLPSWVPDWRPGLSFSFCHLDEDRPAHQRAFAASGRNQPCFIPAADEKVLGLGGFLVDIVEEVGSPWHMQDWTEQHYESAFAQIRLMTLLSRAKGGPIYQHGERREEAVWRIPIGDLEESETFVQTRATSTAQQAYWDFLEVCDAFEQSKLAQSPEELKKFVDRTANPYEGQGVHYSSLMRKMTGKKPFLTQRGYIGMGPTVICPGDVIVIILGSHIPYALRPKPGSPDMKRYSLLGEAYCDGVMDGEILNSGAAQQAFFLV